MPEAVAPHTAQATGEDSACCGTCRLRPISGARRKATERACYVRTFQGPRSTWQAHRDRPADLASACEAIRRSGVAVRLGAYGDPAALPPEIVRELARAARGRVTGYTHAWRRRGAVWLMPYTMASVESARGAAMAHAAGWRTFRAMPDGETQAADEVLCPATTKARLTCNACGLCDGVKPDEKRRSVAIVFH